MKTKILFIIFLPLCLYSDQDSSIHDHTHAQQMANIPSQKTSVTTTHDALHGMHGMYGRYPSTREASGSSWTPDSSQPEGFHIMRNDWMLMFGGYSYLIADVQGGKRGDKKIFDENMFMFMPQKDFNKSTIAFRTMFSLDPATIGKCGYPLLLQTGETCNGKTPLIDKQHPHDLFMELAAVYNYAFKDETSAYLYFGLPGEPALGPPVYIMRFSGEYIPETPIGHHWIDSTHITFGVLTGGIIHKNFKLEASTFRGREPDQHRYDIEKPSFDSYSIRLSLNPTENLALQASYGFLKSPEQLHPCINTKKWIISGIYNKNFGSNVSQTTGVVGINKEDCAQAQPALLLESTFKIHAKHTAFSRFEWLKKSGLFCKNPLSEKVFAVQKLTFGYIYAFHCAHHLEWGIGGLIDFPRAPHDIKKCYGNTLSYMLFLQVRLL